MEGRILEDLTGLEKREVREGDGFVSLFQRTAFGQIDGRRGL